MRFIKIGEDGAHLAADATAWVAVLDTKQDLLFSVAETKAMNFKKAQAHVEALDLAGLKGWRLPSVEELFLLADRTKYSPAIDTDFFPKCKPDWYWTGTAYAPSPGCAWFVLFGNGHSDAGNHSSVCPVRAVRPGQ